MQRIKGPVLVHVVTEKGKGYPFAERDDQRYHGVGKFDKEEGIKVVPTRLPSYTEVFGRTLTTLAEADPRIHAITAAMASGSGLDIMEKALPDRTYDVGIAEQHAVTFAAGLACRGLRPVVAIYSTFLQRALDQIIHDVALQDLPVVFAVDRAGVVGEDGPTHHGVFDLTFLRMVPGMVVMAPRDEDQLRHMVATALAREDGPSAIRYPRGNGLGVPCVGPAAALPIGTAEVLQPGDDLCLLAVGSMVEPARQAAVKLAVAGVAAEVVDMRFVKPLDASLLADVWRRHRVVLTVEENALAGGFGAAVLEWASANAEAGEPRVVCLGIPDEFPGSGDSRRTAGRAWPRCGRHRGARARRLAATERPRGCAGRVLGQPP